MQPKSRWTTVLLTGALAVSAAAPGGPGKVKPTLPPVGSAVLLAGRPFPRIVPFEGELPEPRRTLFVAPGKEAGDGSEAHPWNDLQAALCALGPGDRLRVGDRKSVV